MYLSTLTQRRQDTRRADFAAAPNLYFNHCASYELERESIALWNEYIPFTPHQIYDVLVGGYGIDDMPIAVNLDKDGKFKFHILKDGDVPFSSTAEFNIGTTPDIVSNQINVDPSAQGQGIGRTWLRSMVELSTAFGFSEFHFEAGLQSGGHAWARAGAYLDRDMSRYPLHRIEERYLSENMLARLDLAKPHIDRMTHGWARVLCQLTNKDDIVKVGDIGSITVPSSVLDDAEPTMTKFYEGLSSQPNAAVAVVRAQEEANRLQRVFEDSSGGFHEHVSLSRYLQAASVWHAVVNMADDRQMERVGEYVGGWRNVAPQTLEMAGAS